MFRPRRRRLDHLFSILFSGWRHPSNALPARLEQRRPAHRSPLVCHAPRGRVLAAAICLADRENTARDVQLRLSESRRFDVDQAWIRVGNPSADVPPLRRPYSMAPVLRPKYALLNELLSTVALERYDFLILLDDDILLPYGFLDAFLDLQDHLDFRIAQPARTANSYIDLPIVEEHPGLLARRTLFVEQGPVISFHRSVLPRILPFDMRSPMGWGYENVWSTLIEELGLRMGIIDATPVDHSIRRPVANYSWDEADRGRSALLAEVAHRPTPQCFSVLEAIHELLSTST